MLAAGLDGIRRELSAPDATEENLYVLDTQRRATLGVLPGALDAALDELEKDDVIREALGAHICDRFINAKRLESEDFRLDVTPWELNKYLPNF
jgi:glutamine synthetase